MPLLAKLGIIYPVFHLSTNLTVMWNNIEGVEADSIINFLACSIFNEVETISLN